MHLNFAASLKCINDKCINAVRGIDVLLMEGRHWDSIYVSIVVSSLYGTHIYAHDLWSHVPNCNHQTNPKPFLIVPQTVPNGVPKCCFGNSLKEAQSWDVPKLSREPPKHVSNLSQSKPKFFPSPLHVWDFPKTVFLMFFLTLFQTCWEGPNCNPKLFPKTVFEKAPIKRQF